MKVVVLQPSFLPWLGYFDQYAWCDHFVLYDDVQYDKHGWRNRNRILTSQGVQWLTVPVKTSGQEWPEIRQVEVDSRTPWKRKHLETIRQAYSKTPHFGPVFKALQDYYSCDYPLLLDWNVEGLRWLTQWLGLPWKGLLSSSLPGPGRKTERLIGICRSLGASHYLSGDAARQYLDVSSFESIGCQVHWHGYHHPVYPQRQGEFIPFLSILDLMFWCGPESLSILQSGNR
jgi:hypothetical protein